MKPNFAVFRCALFVLLTCVPTVTVFGQEQGVADDLFGDAQAGDSGLAADPTHEHQHADEDPFGARTADPAAAPGTEKSVLIELPEVGGQAEHRDICRCIGETRSTAVKQIESALQSPLKSNGLDFTDAPLEEVVHLLQEDYGIPIQIDGKALEAIGLDQSEPVTANLHNISLRSALRLMLKPLQLAYIIHDEVLLITTPEEAESQLATCVYDLRGVTEDTSDKTIGDVIDTITSCVSSETWAENGKGEAEIKSLKPGLLVISQTQAVHEQIVGLLDTIRDVRQSKNDAAANHAHATDSESVVTRAYVFQAGQGSDSEKVRGQIQRLIVQSMPDQQWEGRLESGEPVVLTILPDRIVLRHRPAVHEKLRALLVDSGIATPANSAQSAGGFGGGGLGGQAEGGGFFQVDSRARHQ
jgi:hypothetical protein